MPPSLVVSVHLCPGGDVVVQHQQMQLFLTLLVVDGGDQHPAGLNAHHGTGRQIGDGKQRLAYQLFRLVIGVNAAQNDPIHTGSVVQSELQQLLGLLDSFAFLELYGTEIGLGEGLIPILNKPI